MTRFHQSFSSEKEEKKRRETAGVGAVEEI